MTEYLCPTCKTALAWNPENPHRPFCSERCKNRDFIDWAHEKNQIAGSAEYDEINSEMIGTLASGKT